MAVLNLIIIVLTNIIELKFVKELNGRGGKKEQNWDALFFKTNRLFMYCTTHTSLEEKVKGI